MLSVVPFAASVVDDTLVSRGVNETAFPARWGEDHRRLRTLPVLLPARTGEVAARYVSLGTLGDRRDIDMDGRGR